MAGGRRNRGQYGGLIVSGATMCLEVGETGTLWWRQCVRSRDVAGGRGDR